MQDSSYNRHQVRQFRPLFCIYLVLIFRRDLSARLNLSEEEGEKWIVNLIRETRMGTDVKIDLEKVGLSTLSSLVYLRLFLYFRRQFRILSRSIGQHYLFINLSSKRLAASPFARKPLVLQFHDLVSSLRNRKFPLIK